MGFALHDWKCTRCNGVEERLEDRDVENVKCSQCGGIAERIFSFRGGVAGEESVWIPSVLEVVDKTSRDPATREFLSSPTRTNYRRWMKANNLRPLEEGEKGKRPELDIRRHTDKIMELRQERRKITVRG